MSGVFLLVAKHGCETNSSQQMGVNLDCMSNVKQLCDTVEHDKILSGAGRLDCVFFSSLNSYSL